MSIPDKIAAARKIEEFLQGMVTNGGFRLRYRIVVDPPMTENRDWEHPEIMVDLSGPDSSLLLERGGELLRALEHVAVRMLHLESEEHEKVSFDCMNHKALRLEELKMAAGVAAERVMKTGQPYHFGPMSSRERRVLHLALREFPDLRTESEGEPPRRAVVIFPKTYTPPKSTRPSFSLRKRR